jgi:UDP-N-acetylmuramyl tripeptide synthase
VSGVKLLAVWVGKLILAVLHLLGRRGNALPGLIVEKIFPGYLPAAMTALAHGVVVVSGTNGKTTTTKMVATALGERLRVLTNDTGSNFVRGAITACVAQATWRGRLPYDVAVFELDEAWAVRFVHVVPPRRVLLLNVMRDQLDRFGEIDSTAALLGQVAAATTGHVVRNRDDPRIAALATTTAARISHYGVAPQLRAQFPNDEELYGGPITVSEVPADVELCALPSDADPRIRLRIGDSEQALVLRAAGPHNAQNAAGAAAVACTFGFDAATVRNGLAKVDPAFGRGQSFMVDGRTVVLHLVKNPAGFRQTLHTLDGGPVDGIVIAINDDYADGRDVSWLWDVEFGTLAGRAARLATAGTRAADMAVRLHYDEIAVEHVEPRLDAALEQAVTAAPAGGTVVIFSTYTAMWALHPLLERIGSRA